MTLLPAALPPRCWLAGATVPPALLAAPQPGRVALLIEGGRIAAVATAPQGDAAVIDLRGATVLSAFVDPHTHLDKGDLLATGMAPERDLFRAIDAVRADYPRWSADALRLRIGFALRTAWAHGTRALLSYCDWAAPPAPGAAADAGPLAWQVLAGLRDEWRGRIELIPASLAPIDLLTDAAQAERLGRAVAAARGVLGVFVYPAPHVAALIPLAFDLAERFDLALDFHVDEHLSPPIANLPTVARLAAERGWGARTVCDHACLLSAMAAAERDATLDAVAAAGIGLVSLPYTNLHLQDSSHAPPHATPRQRGILPVHEAAARGIDVAFGSDNHRDPFFPAGDLDPLQTLALAALGAQLDDPLPRWAHAVTRTPARRLGLAWDGVLRPGAPADLVLHSGRDSVEVLSRPTRGRAVLRAGQPIDTAPPDFRELDALRA
jgi:cytosine/creatinine deaminase